MYLIRLLTLIENFYFLKNTYIYSKNNVNVNLYYDFFRKNRNLRKLTETYEKLTKI
jgi:hypothetical protein